ncbi:MAG: hypothetical protein ACTSU5_16475 [Promethearchaeota archaeon]
MLYRQLSEDEIELRLETLASDDSIAPFSRFTARGDIADSIDVPNPRKAIDRAISRAIRQTALDHSTRLFPILGSAGSGKTHAYWAFKDKELKIREARAQESVDDDFSTSVEEEVDWSIVYVPSPPAPIRILLHVYTCMIDEIGADILGVVAHKLVERWGGKKKKHLGLFGKADIEEVIQAGIREYPGVFADCVKALCIFELDKDRKPLAERWLLGEDLDEDELDTIGINSVIEDDDICLAMIKLFTSNMDRVIVFYFDELESPYRTHGQEAEMRFLETLKRLYNEVQNIVIVAAILKEIWPRILEIADQALRSRMEPELELKPFTLADSKLYFAKAMEKFWNDNNLNPPLYPLFPLNDAILETIYKKTNGNARDLIKLCRMFVDRIVDGEMTLEQLESDTGTLPTAQPPVAAPQATPQGPAAGGGGVQAGSEVAKTIEQILESEEYTIQANPMSVAGACLKCIRVFGERHHEGAFTVKFDFKFELQRKSGSRTYTLAGLVEFGGAKIGVEVPSIKGFDRSGGVAAYYAAERLAAAIQQGILDQAILVVPEGTGGKKYLTLLKQNEGKVHVVEFNEDTALDLIKSSMKEPNRDGWRIANVVFGDIPEPTEQVPEQGPGSGEDGGEGSGGDDGSSAGGGGPAPSPGTGQ